MPIDFRRCAEAAAHAALAEAFARPEMQQQPHSRRRLGPVRAVLLGAGLVTGARVALDADLRRTMLQAVARRFPLEELLDELVLEADVVPDEADDAPEESGADREGSGDEPELEAEDETEPEAEDETELEAEDETEPEAEDETKPEPEAEGEEEGEPDAGAEPEPGSGSGAKRSGAQSRRSHASRTRGAKNGQGRRKPPSRGSRA